MAASAPYHLGAGSALCGHHQPSTATANTMTPFSMKSEVFTDSGSYGAAGGDSAGKALDGSLR